VLDDFLASTGLDDRLARTKLNYYSADLPSTWIAWQYRFFYGFLNQGIGKNWFYTACLRVEQRFKPVF
jgi:hypothetical protein